MPYEKEYRHTFSHPVGDVSQSARHCVTFMGGKVLKEDQGAGLLHAQMDKKLFGEYLGDRSKLEMQITSVNDNETEIGQKLMFGARDGVVETMTAAFFEQVEKHLTGK